MHGRADRLRRRRPRTNRHLLQRKRVIKYSQQDSVNKCDTLYRLVSPLPNHARGAVSKNAPRDEFRETFHGKRYVGVQIFDTN